MSHSTCTDKLLSHVSPFHVFLSLPSRAACIIWRSLLILSISRSFCVRPPKALYSTVVPSARPYLQGNGGGGHGHRQFAAPAELTCLLSDRNHVVVYKSRATSIVGIGVVTFLGNTSDLVVSVMLKKY